MHRLGSEPVDQTADLDDRLASNLGHRQNLKIEKNTEKAASATITRKIELDDREGGQAADAFGAARDLKAFIAADRGNDRREKRRLDHADPKGSRAQRQPQLVHELRDRDPEHPPGHQGAAEQPHQIGENRQHRQSQQQSEQARDHQHLDRVEADRAQRVDLLVDLHRADLGGKGAAGAAGDDDRGHQHAQFAQDADRQQVDGIDLGAELAQLVGALVGDHHPDQKRQHADDGQRIDPGLLHLSDHRGQPEPARVPQQAQRGLAHQADKTEQTVDPGDETERNLADPGDEPYQAVMRRPRVSSRGVKPTGADLIEQRREARSQVAHLYRIAARRQIVLGAQQQPGPGAVDPLEPAEIDGHPPVLRQLQGLEPSVELGGARHQPFPSRRQDQRSGRFGLDEGGSDRRHDAL